MKLKWLVNNQVQLVVNECILTFQVKRFEVWNKLLKDSKPGSSLSLSSSTRTHVHTHSASLPQNFERHGKLRYKLGAPWCDNITRNRNSGLVMFKDFLSEVHFFKELQEIELVP